MDIRDGLERRMKYYFEMMIKRHRGEITMEKLGDVCEIKTGKYITRDMKIKGEYPVYGGGNPSFYINQYNYEDEIIIAKDGVSENCVRYEKNKFFLNHHGWVIKTKDSKKQTPESYLVVLLDVIATVIKSCITTGIKRTN